MTEPASKFRSVRDVRNHTGLSKSTIYQAIRDGHLPCVQPPGTGRILIAAADLDRWLEAGRSTGPRPRSTRGRKSAAK